MRRTAYFTLVGGNCCNFWVFYVVFGCKNLVFKNPACVKEMTNMKYVNRVVFVCFFLQGYVPVLRRDEIDLSGKQLLQKLQKTVHRAVACP